jgi:hypothetical protein
MSTGIEDEFAGSDLPNVISIRLGSMGPKMHEQVALTGNVSRRFRVAWIKSAWFLLKGSRGSFPGSREATRTYARVLSGIENFSVPWFGSRQRRTKSTQYLHDMPHN